MAEALSFLDPARVAERAGVARSAFHHHWSLPADAEGVEEWTLASIGVNALVATMTEPIDPDDEVATNG